VNALKAGKKPGNTLICVVALSVQGSFLFTKNLTVYTPVSGNVNVGFANVLVSDVDPGTPKSQ
jgi:hypothetical protein